MHRANIQLVAKTLRNVRGLKSQDKTGGAALSSNAKRSLWIAKRRR